MTLVTIRTYSRLFHVEQPREDVYGGMIQSSVEDWDKLYKDEEAFRRYEAAHEAFMKRLCETWVETFQEWIDERYIGLKRKPAIKTRFVDWDRPFSLNTDAAEFELSMPVTELRRIISVVFRNEGAFENYLYELYRPRDGFSPYSPSNLDECLAYRREMFKKKLPPDAACWPTEWYHFVCRVLDFWLFAYNPEDEEPEPDDDEDDESAYEYDYEVNTDDFGTRFSSAAEDMFYSMDIPSCFEAAV